VNDAFEALYRCFHRSCREIPTGAEVREIYVKNEDEFFDCQCPVGALAPELSEIKQVIQNWPIYYPCGTSSPYVIVDGT